MLSRSGAIVPTLCEDKGFHHRNIVFVLARHQWF
jgi:hypothetical protein